MRYARFDCQSSFGKGWSQYEYQTRSGIRRKIGELGGYVRGSRSHVRCGRCLRKRSERKVGSPECGRRLVPSAVICVFFFFVIGRRISVDKLAMRSPYGLKATVEPRQNVRLTSRGGELAKQAVEISSGRYLSSVRVIYEHSRRPRPICQTALGTRWKHLRQTLQREEWPFQKSAWD